MFSIDPIVYLYIDVRKDSLFRHLLNWFLYQLQASLAAGTKESNWVKTRTGRILTITMNRPNFLLFDSTTTFQLCSTVARWTWIEYICTVVNLRIVMGLDKKSSNVLILLGI